MIETSWKLSILRQTKILHVSRSSYYYEKEYTDEDLEIMWVIDEIYTEHCYYGARRISAELKARSYDVGRKRARTYMWIMGIEPIYPKQKTSTPNPNHKKYPYLLKWVEITRADQVRSTDITCIKIPWGFVYLMAIIDRYSRKIIAWDVSPSMDSTFCCEVLTKALQQGSPEIFNSDQGSQFTSSKFLEILENTEIKISMDGVRRRVDNVRIERLWRTIKYEDIHIHEYKTPIDVYHWLSLYIQKYNNSRLHSALWYKTPESVYSQN